MSTDYQQARVALGSRLRELRFTCPGGRLTGQQLAQRLGWQGSKVSKLENGKQTASPEDLRAWADATEQPGVYAELAARLAGFESHIRSWRRALANGFKPQHEGLSAEIDRTSEMWIWEESVIPGLLQTPEYARHVIQRYSELLGGVSDVEAAVRSRAQRQEWLYRPGRKLHVLVWEAALRSLICPPSVLAAQLDRLTGMLGMDTVELGVIPFTASVKIVPANGFWVLDDHLVVAEDWHAEMWLDDADNIGLYSKVWATLRESAVYGADAHNVINAARRVLSLR
ncbi:MULTISPECIES: helix-turn-helix domain-containing protein [unclassified Streptomyces]|uniref:helix-turn-helix domain-containing protein n=1 Tax=unclassified Streptomyces TaxID=2593676 RepID=UPI000DACC3FD|nr:MULTISPECIES: helix-turn-helix transcriptional regulator [unclassified Streptomyces]PZT77218.1 transcriptional regulator [Streptomyces sp. AC1-42W]PZT78830.1 transcriptional regulator [Streptomyces sp. AC1-42T]